MRNLFSCLFIPLLTLILSCSGTAQERIKLFPIEHYSQQVSVWLNPKDDNYQKNLLSPEQQALRLQAYYKHMFSTAADGLSPWSANFVKPILTVRSPMDLRSAETSVINWFSNAGKSSAQLGYASNFRPYTSAWLEPIAANMQLEQWNKILQYEPRQRAITTRNLLARFLPTHDPYFYSHKLAGEGYPFDNLQNSVIWLGTPVYIVAESRDHLWLLVLTSSFMGWVQAEGVARVDESFINTWQTTQLAASIKNTVGLNHQQHFLIYLGTVLPLQKKTDKEATLLIPTRLANGNASIDFAKVAADAIVTLPWTLTPEHIAQLIEQLKGRPYGWNNYNFYNDCSAEMQSLYTPFGIWLPRHSAAQVTQGKIIDLAKQTTEQRIKTLMERGKGLTTLVYLPGHIFMYVGKYHLADQPSLTAMSYQNLWGLKPKDNSYRSVIGGSVN